MELATFWYELETRATAPPDETNSGGCPFQHARLCAVHQIRPFGCRIFFCDPASNQWQTEQYERFHARLKRLHEALNVAYLYVEWREALRAIGLMPVSTQPAEL
jgi:Fe-S-cluster containining protein